MRLLLTVSYYGINIIQIFQFFQFRTININQTISKTLLKTIETKTWHLIIFLNFIMILQYFSMYKLNFPYHVLNLTYVITY